MRIFNQMVFDGYVTGTAPVYSDPAYYETMGLTDQLSIGGYTAQVTGTGPPSLTVQIEQSFDNYRWQARNTTAEVSATTMVTTGETIFVGQDGDPTARPTLALARLKITLGAANNTARVRIWVTGRDREQ